MSAFAPVRPSASKAGGRSGHPVPVRTSSATSATVRPLVSTRTSPTRASSSRLASTAAAAARRYRTSAGCPRNGSPGIPGPPPCPRNKIRSVRLSRLDLASADVVVPPVHRRLVVDHQQVAGLPGVRIGHGTGGLRKVRIHSSSIRVPSPNMTSWGRFPPYMFSSMVRIRPVPIADWCHWSAWLHHSSSAVFRCRRVAARCRVRTSTSPPSQM
jgi:hypothetical protein